MNELDFFYLLFALIIPIVLLALLILTYKKKSAFKHKWVKVLTWNIVLILFVLFSVFSLGETYFRFAVDTTDSFAISKLSKRWVKKHYKLNNRNLRDNIDYENESAKKVRINIIGDSFSEGYGVSNVEDRFSNILRSKKQNWEFHNLSRRGLNTKAQLDILNYLKHVNYELDVVLLVYCLNDLDQYLEAAKKIYKRIQRFNSKLSYIEKESYFINSLSFRIFAQQDPDFLNYCEFVKSGYKGEAWEHQKITLLRLIDLLASMNKKLMVVTFPLLQSPFSEYQFKETHEQLNLFWKENDIPHLDLLSVYKNELGESLTVNDYDAHPNEKAHKIAADEILTFLESNLVD